MFRDLCSRIYTVMPSHAVVCVWSSLPAAPQTIPVFAEARRNHFQGPWVRMKPPMAETFHLYVLIGLDLLNF